MTTKERKTKSKDLKSQLQTHRRISDKYIVDVIQTSPYEKTIVFDNIRIDILNSYRRVMMSHILTYCFDNFEVITNETSNHDDFVTSRISLIRFNQTLDEPEEEMLAKKFVLHKKTTEDTDIYDMMSSDIESIDDITKKYCRPDVQLYKLYNNQELHVKFSLSRGIGRTHAKYSPISNVTITYDGHADNPSTTAKMYIETNGNITARHVLLKGIDVITSSLENLSNSINNKNEAKVITGKADNNYIWTIQDEDHTLGNLITRQISEKHAEIIEYVGYIVKHPLKQVLNIKLIPKNENSGEAIFKKAIDELIKIYTELGESIKIRIT